MSAVEALERVTEELRTLAQQGAAVTVVEVHVFARPYGFDASYEIRWSS